MNRLRILSVLRLHSRCHSATRGFRGDGIGALEWHLLDVCSLSYLCYDMLFDSVRSIWGFETAVETRSINGVYHAQIRRCTDKNC